MNIIILEEEFYSQIEPLEQNYLEFLEISESFLGWLLTLSDEEFHEVYLRTIFPPGEEVDGTKITSLAFPIVELVHKGTLQAPEDELYKRQVEIRQYVRIIYAVKAGLLRYQVADTDPQWRIEVTEKGTRLADALNVVQSLILTKQDEKGNENAEKSEGSSDSEDGPGLTVV